MADAYRGYARAVSRRLNRCRPDVVHVMNYWSWCPQFRNRVPGSRIVLSMHSEWLSQAGAGRVERALEATDAIFAVSEHVASLIRAAVPGYRGEIVTAHNGVDVEEFRPASGGDARGDGVPRILFVGRVSPEKGIHTLIEAFARVASRIEAARLDIVGARSTLREDFIVGISDDPVVRALRRFYDGSMGAEYQDYLDALVRKLGLTGKVRFVGRVPHGELPARYGASAVVVNPSVSETFGISVVEAMACGLPVVAARVGGMVETVVDGETGLLVEPEQPAALADAITSLLQDAERSRRMGASGRARAAARFSWGARADKLLATYRMVLGREHA
jgi:glycosyltransferase involved in cell wall biosynthesis